jgi:hypothetical protein
MVKFVLVSGLIVGVSTSGLAQRPDLNSFLNRRALSVSQLIAQAKSDPVVKERFVRHFAMSPKDLYAYFSSLHLSSLSSTRILRVYSVPAEGYIKMHVESFAIGTPVYVDLAGNPVLIAKCGNPLTLGPSDKLAENEVVRQPVEPDEAIRELPEPLTSSADLASRRLMAFTPDVSSIPGVVTSATSPIPIVATAIPIGQLLLGLIGLGSLTIVDHNDDTTLPEPATLIALSVGTIALLRRKRR